jgi:hypothetical protein
MRYRKLTATGDYSFGSGQLDFWNNVPEAVGQAVQTRLLLWLGEWFLDINAGTPYMQGILGKYSQETADTVIKDQIIETQGMVDIADYSSTRPQDQNTRGMLVTTSIDTIYGTTSVQIANYGNY